MAKVTTRAQVTVDCTVLIHQHTANNDSQMKVSLSVKEIHSKPLTSFLLLFMFLISSILHHHPALFHRYTLILDRLLTFLVAFSTLILKLSFSQSLSLHSRLSLHQADLLEL